MRPSVLAALLGNATGAVAALRQASSRRVDIVHFGDSNGFFGSYGFAWGLSRALYGKYGCYATGITAPTGTGAADPTPTDYQSVAGVDTGWASTETGNSAGNATGFTALSALWWTGTNTGLNLIAPRARWVAVGAAGNLGGITVNEGHPIGLSNLLRFWVGYSRAPSGALSGGSITPNIRYNRGATTVLVTSGAISSTGGAGPEVAVTGIDLTAGARTAGCDIILRAGGGANPTASIGYLFTRVEAPNSNTGLSWHNLFATAGKCAYDMAASLITNSTNAQLTNYFSEVRRLQVSKSLSPIVVIFINTNFNDTSAVKSPAPSLGPNGGTTVAGSKEAFVDNLQAIKNRIEAIWTANGWPLTELYWLFMASHIGPNFAAELSGYKSNRDFLNTSALGTAARTTVIDMSTLQPPGSTANTVPAWQAAAANLGWYSTQTWDGTAATPNPPLDTNMIHLTEPTNAGAFNAASRGYDGVAALMASVL